MKATNLQFAVILGLCLIAGAVKLRDDNQVLSANDDNYWSGLCLDEQALQSPINIVPPFTHINFNTKFNFYPEKQGSLVNNGGRYLQMEGDFGSFTYGSNVFQASMLQLKSPSEHTIGSNHKKFPLELQIYATSQDKLQVNIAILFDNSDDDGEFLTDLGLGEEIIQNLDVDQSYKVPNPVDISKVIPTNNDFFIYQGSNTFPNCHPAVWFVSFETFKVSKKQLADLPKKILNEGRPQQSSKNRTIFVTFTKDTFTTLTATFNDSTASNKSTTSTKTNSATKDTTSKKNRLHDSFEIVGNEYAHDDTIYPFAALGSKPRSVRDDTQIVVSDSKDSKAVESETIPKTQKTTSLRGTMKQKDTAAASQTDGSVSFLAIQKKESKVMNSLNLAKSLKSGQMLNSLIQTSLGSMSQSKQSSTNATASSGSNSTVSGSTSVLDQVVSSIPDDTDSTVVIPVAGPKVSGAIKKQFYYEAGKGNYAFNKHREWDGVEIYDTRIWNDLCKYSLYQSPIQIDLNQAFTIEPHKLVFNYTNAMDATYSVSNDGNKIVINGSFGQAAYGSHVFDAYSMQLHHPSEHTIGPDMSRADFELQILHYDEFGLKTIIAVFFDRNQEQTDEDSDFLTAIGLSGITTKALASGTSRTVTGLNVASIVEQSEHFISYEGSITTPPCTDRVKWYILNKKNPCSDKQVASFKKLFGETSNVRGIQPLNGRTLSLF